MKNKNKKRLEIFELVLICCLGISIKLGLMNNLLSDNFKWIFLILTDYFLISLVWPFLKNKFIKKINIFSILVFLVLCSLLICIGKYANPAESLYFFGFIIISFFFVSKIMRIVLLVIIPILAIIGGFQSFYSFEYLFLILTTNVVLFLPFVLSMVRIISKIGKLKFKKEGNFIGLFIAISFVFYLKIINFNFLIILLKIILSPGFLLMNQWFKFLGNGDELFVFNWGIPLQILYFYLVGVIFKEIKIKTDKSK